MERFCFRTQVLVPPDASKRKGARPGRNGVLYAFMRRVLASEHGGELYRQRQPMIEAVFGQTKHNRGMARFHRRGRAAVRTEWRLITATHNLMKLYRAHWRRRRPDNGGRRRQERFPSNRPTSRGDLGPPSRQPLTRQPRVDPALQTVWCVTESDSG
jgi:Transposase DDE domain